jgi:hypothetical protein
MTAHIVNGEPHMLCATAHRPSIQRGLFIAALLLAVPAGAATLEVGADKQYKMPSEAIAKAGDGDTILIQPGEYFDCAVVKQDKLIIQGVKPDGSAIMTDKGCAGKGLLVTAGNDITVRNLTLTRVRVQDQNGAGIRAEGTNLLVDNVKFINNQNGILAAPNLDSTITIRNSEFAKNGGCNPSCTHGIYVNQLKLLHVENSKFWEHKIAHHIKSRALRTEVIGCDIRDNVVGTSSYLIEVPNGGNLVARNNTLQKGPKSDNHTAAIMIGNEGVTQPTREILIENNTFTNDGTYDTVLLDNQTAQVAVLKGNKISGRAKPLRGDGAVQ